MDKPRESDRHQCVRCDEWSAVHENKIEFSGLVEGEEVKYKAPGWRCTQCGETWATGNDLEAHDYLKAEVYRSSHQLMTADQMEKVRQELQFSKKSFCEFLEVPRMTYDRWLKGIIQGRPMDAALRAKLDERTAAWNNLTLQWSRFGSLSSEQRGNRPSSLRKLIESIVFFLKHRGRHALGKLYLNKLCWYGDQLAYNVKGESITGTPYLAMEWGPVISSYDQVFRAMELSRTIRETGTNNFELVDDEYQYVELTSEDKRILLFVWNTFKDSLPKLANRSHEELGWKKTPKMGTMSYKHSSPLRHLKTSDFSPCPS